MSKLREFFGFGNRHKKDKQKNTSATSSTISTTTTTKIPTTNTANIPTDKRKLESDAIGVFDNNDNAGLDYAEANTTTSSSSELTAQTVQQLFNTNDNYNSSSSSNNLNDVPTIPNSLAPSNNVTSQNNMNVNNAQQQLVMHFNNANNVHFGSVYHIKSNDNNNNNKPKETQIKHPITKKTPSIVSMMQSQIEPGVRILDTISTHLGEGWKQIMRDLGHTEGQIEQAIIDHQMHGNVREVIYQLLLHWVRSAEDNEATLGRITTLLWERKHHEVVHRMKIAWKDLQKQQQQQPQS